RRGRRRGRTRAGGLRTEVDRRPTAASAGAPHCARRRPARRRPDATVQRLPGPAHAGWAGRRRRGSARRTRCGAMADDVRFPSSCGPELAGVLETPDGEVRGWGLVVHGFTLGKDSPATFRIARGLAEAGVGMLRFDCLGLGDSAGEWGDGSFTVKVDD